MVPFVLILLRYARDIDAGLAEAPEEMLFRDRVLQILRDRLGGDVRIAGLRLTRLTPPAAEPVAHPASDRGPRHNCRPAGRPRVARHPP